MRSIWSDEGEVRADVPVEKLREAELWREATVASPVPWGLAAFAIAAFSLGIALAVGTPLIGVVPIVVIFGGITLWTMGLFSLRKGSSLIATFFGIIGSFYITWSIYQVYATQFAPAGQLANLATGMAVFLFLTAFVLAYLMLAAWSVNTALALVLLSLFLSFVALGLGLLIGGPWLLGIGGWLSVVASICALYTSFATILNSVLHKEQLPLVSVRKEAGEARSEA